MRGSVIPPRELAIINPAMTLLVEYRPFVLALNHQWGGREPCLQAISPGTRKFLSLFFFGRSLRPLNPERVPQTAANKLSPQKLADRRPLCLQWWQTLLSLRRNCRVSVWGDASRARKSMHLSFFSTSEKARRANPPPYLTSKRRDGNSRFWKIRD